MPRVLSLTLCGVSAACAALSMSAALAQSDNVTRLPEVKVTGTKPEEGATGPAGGYNAKRSATATKTDTPLGETPQSVTVVTRERIEEQGATSIQDALNYAAGVRSDAYGLDSRTDSVRVRGGYPDEYRDGLRRQLAGYYTSTTRVDPYTLERIEVLRGPASMLFGQGGTGGIINEVSKRPLGQAQREVGVQFGSFDRKQLQTDLTGPIDADGRFLYRLVALVRDSDTQVDFVPDDRRLVAPTLTWLLADTTTLTLQANWQQDRSGSTLQFQPWSGTVSPNPNGRIPTNRFLGEPAFDHYDSDRTEAGWLFEHRFNDNWALRQNLRVTRNKVDYTSLYPDSYTVPGDSYTDVEQRTLDRFAWVDKHKVRMAAADQHVEGRFATGPVAHQVLVGLDVARFKQDTSGSFDVPISQGGTVEPIDVYNPVYTGYTPLPLTDDPTNSLRQMGVYVQDQLKILERVIVVLGLRHDRVTNHTDGASDEKDRATTKRAGVMVLAGGGWAPYVSYSESFTPLAGTDFFGNRFRPLRGEQLEAGVKWEAPTGKLSFTAAAYDLKEKNRQVPDPANPVVNTIQIGESKTRGVEVELLGRVLPELELSAHYNYTDLDPQLEGGPKHSAALWSVYRFALAGVQGFSAGAGARYMNAFHDGIAPQTPSVTLFDAMLAWNAASWRYALNVANLSDKTYVSLCLARGDCFYGARRTIVGGVTYRW